MAHYDVFEKAIEGLGIFFRKLFSKVMMLHESKATDIQVAEIGDMMKQGLGLDLNDIAGLTNEAFLASLQQKRLSPTDLSNMINVLVKLAKVKNGLPADYDTNQLLSKALFLGDHLANKKTVFIENIKALDEAKDLLK